MNAREAALSIIVNWDDKKRVHMEHLVGDYLAGDEELDGRDRRFLAELCYGLVRHRNTLHTIAQVYSHQPLHRTARSIRNALAFGLYQRIYLDTPAHAVVDTTIRAWEAVYAADEHPQARTKMVGFLNASLRRACGEIEHLDADPEHDLSPQTVWAGERWVRIKALDLPHPRVNMPEMLGVKYSHPPDLLRLWLERYELPELVGMLRWNNTIPSSCVVLRADVNPDNYRRKLSIIGIEAEETSDPRSLRVGRPGPIERLPGYAAGEFWVQDWTARRLAQMLPLRENATLLDLCSAPGGKLATYLDRTNLKSVVAADVSRPRLDVVRQNLERLRLYDLRKVQLLESPENPDHLRIEHGFDQVAVDVPCSNSGVFARRHEARWRFQPENIRRLQQEQIALLRAGARHLNPGGDLLYTTCSIEPAENSQVLMSVMRSVPGLQLVSEVEVVPGNEEGDGGYGALLRRRS